MAQENEETSHRLCEWTPNKRSDHPQLGLEVSKNIVVHDHFLTVDSDCAKSQIASLEPSAVFYAMSVTSGGATNQYWNAKLAAGFWDYENLALFRGMRGISYFGGDATKSGREYYKQALKDELQKTGYGRVTANAVAEQCIKAEPRWCEEKNRITHFHVWRIIFSDWTMGVGTFLILLGVSGTLLFKPLTWLWSHTAGVIIHWVKNGK